MGSVGKPTLGRGHLPLKSSSYDSHQTFKLSADHDGLVPGRAPLYGQVGPIDPHAAASPVGRSVDVVDDQVHQYSSDRRIQVKEQSASVRITILCRLK